MSKIEQQLAEWRAKRDAARQVGSKPLAPVINSSRLNPPVARSTGLKGERARSPAGCENERAPAQAPAAAEPGAAKPRYLTATKSSQHRGALEPAAAAGRPDDSSTEAAQVLTPPQIKCCSKIVELLRTAAVQVCSSVPDKRFGQLLLVLQAASGQTAAPRPAVRSAPTAAGDDGMDDDLLQPEGGEAEAGGGHVGPSSGIAARLEALRREAAIAPSSAPAGSQPASRSANGCLLPRCWR